MEKLDAFKLTGLNRIHPKVPKESAEVISEPLAIIFENSWRLVKVLVNWEREIILPIFKKGKIQGTSNQTVSP